MDQNVDAMKYISKFGVPKASRLSPQMLTLWCGGVVVVRSGEVAEEWR